MARGGKRPGAGRKAGAASTKTREVADRTAADGITPLEIMIETMRGLWAEATTADGRPNIGKRMQACAIAEKAAPYVHPKLSSVDASVAVTDGQGTKEQRDAAVAAALNGDVNSDP